MRPIMRQDNDWPQPHGITTYVSYPELSLLQRYARSAGSVLEIGTQFGFTAIGMAMAGASVTSVDPHYEGPDDRNPDTWGRFLANCRAQGFTEAKPTSQSHAWLIPPTTQWGQIYAIREAIEDVGDPRLWGVGAGQPREGYGLVFVDGNHIWPCPARDIRIALAHLRAPGYVALHDVTPHWPGVWRAVHEAVEWGLMTEVAHERTMAVYQAAGYAAVPPTS